MKTREEIERAAVEWSRSHSSELASWDWHLVNFAVQQINEALVQAETRVENISPWNQQELDFQRRAILAIRALKIDQGKK